MSNNQKKDRKEAQRLIISGTALISISIILALFLGIMGCSGGTKLNPADPASSKLKKGDISQDSTSNTANGLLTNGTNSREGESGSSGNVTPEMTVIQQLLNSGKHFGNSPLTGHMTVGVFNAESLRPIPGAYVAIGNGSKLMGVTDADGYCTIQNVVPRSPVSSIGNVVATAGANGYELVTYAEVKNSVVVFLLNPLTPSDTGTGFVEGTFDFGTDEFLCSATASNVKQYIDAIMQPSGPGDTDDTYSYQMIPGRDSIACFAGRNPVTERIQNFFYRTINIADGETLTLDRSDENGLEWLTYGSRANLFSGKFSLVPYNAADIDSITATCYYIFNNYGAVEMTDTVQYEEAAMGYTVLTTYANTFTGIDYSPIPIKPDAVSLEYNKVEFWVDVLYEDGAGCRFKLADSLIGLKSVNRKMVSPPVIVSSPVDGRTGLGLTTTIAWIVDKRDTASESMITLIDQDNGNRWVIFAPASVRQFQLPSLPSTLDGFGLTVDNEVELQVETVMGSSDMAASIGGSTSDGISFQEFGALEPRCFSSTIDFTP